MASSCILFLGQQFSSYNEIKDAISKFQEEQHVTFWRRDSRTIERAQKIGIRCVLNNDLVYHDLLYACVKGGRKYTSKSAGQRPNQRTFRDGCKSCVRFRQKGDKLEVVKLDMNHNHPVDELSAINFLPKRKVRGRPKGAELTSISLPKQRRKIGEIRKKLIASARKTPSEKDETEANGEPVVIKPDLPITPHYLALPPFPQPVHDSYHGMMDMTYHQIAQPVYAAPYHHPLHHSFVSEELVLKARVANTGDSDFIEVELPRTSLTYEALLTTLCCELEVDKRLVQKLRKLPNTVLRKDKDVERLWDLQELELVLIAEQLASSLEIKGDHHCDKWKSRV